MSEIMFGAGGISRESDARFIFEKAFGAMGLMPEEIYYDPLNKVDKREDMFKVYNANLSKAPSIGTTTGSSYTAYGLFPAFLDASIVDRTMAETPLVGLMPRKAIDSLHYTYNLISAKGGAQFLPADSALSPQVDTRSCSTKAVSYLYAVGRVLGPALRGGAGYINLLAEDLRVKTASMNEKLENEVINGNTSTDANGFNGMIQTFTTNSTAVSANVTLQDIRTMEAQIHNAYGRVKWCVTDAATHNYIKGLLMDYQRFIERPSDADMPFGIPNAFMLDSMLFIRDQFMPTTSGSRRIIFIDPRFCYFIVLQDITYEELAKDNDSNKYMLKWYGSWLSSYEGSCGQLTSIT